METFVRTCHFCPTSKRAIFDLFAIIDLLNYLLFEGLNHIMWVEINISETKKPMKK